MARSIPSDEFDLICEVERRGREGGSFADLAAEMGRAVGTLRYALEKHGLEAVMVWEVRSKIGGAPLADLVASGQLVRQPNGDLVEVA